MRCVDTELIVAVLAYTALWEGADRGGEGRERKGSSNKGSRGVKQRNNGLGKDIASWICLWNTVEALTAAGKKEIRVKQENIHRKDKESMSL